MIPSRFQAWGYRNGISIDFTPACRPRNSGAALSVTTSMWRNVSLGARTWRSAARIGLVGSVPRERGIYSIVFGSACRLRPPACLSSGNQPNQPSLRWQTAATVAGPSTHQTTHRTLTCLRALVTTSESLHERGPAVTMKFDNAKQVIEHVTCASVAVMLRRWCVSG